MPPSLATAVFSLCANHSKSRMTVFPYWTRVCVFHSTLLERIDWFRMIYRRSAPHTPYPLYSFRHLESTESSDGPTTVVRKPANVSRLFCRRTTKYRRHTCVRRARSKTELRDLSRKHVRPSTTVFGRCSEPRLRRVNPHPTTNTAVIPYYPLSSKTYGIRLFPT